VVAATVGLGALAAQRSDAAEAPASPAMQAVLDYARGQRTTGFLVVQNRKVLAEANWPAPADLPFRNFTYETTPDGALLEDVASQQKSFVAVLAAVAADRGLLDVERPVSDCIGAGWSHAAKDQEAQIRVIHVLTMSSGLTTDFAFAAPPGTVFLYNTPVYATIKRVLSAAAKQSLETITRDWLTAPAGMRETSWRQRPAAFADVGNPTGLVSSPRDTAKLGQLVLDGGKSASGARIVSGPALKAMFLPTPINPAYGRLWWLNGGAYAIRPLDRRVEGPLIPAAPSDLVAALGALDRKLYVTPSLNLVVVRMGDATPDKDFDQQLWLRLAPVLGGTPRT
ncbi:MAG TPA: serine hydrolase, partial [Caulobacteraceae bacterium]|nr:serine hydrolase [Caulobacteraceae bacterium]